MRDELGGERYLGCISRLFAKLDVDGDGYISLTLTLSLALALRP